MRQIAAAVFIALFLTAGVASAAQVTIVMNSGERYNGQLFYDRGARVGLDMNGQRRYFQHADIAVIMFVPGTPSGDEISKLTTSDNPPERERHMLVLRDGRAIQGKVYHWETDSVTFDANGGGRDIYPAGQVARVYLSGPPARRLFESAANQNVGGEGPSPGRGWGRGRGPGRGEPQASVRVEANRPWTDTGLVVQPGEPISFNANGTVTFGANMTAGPDGNKDMPPSANYPVRSMSVGALIGRVGNGQPFPIGSARTPIEMPNGGRLFLGVNDDHREDNSDGFDVQIFRRF
jgi:hypothetical protein